MRTRTSLSYSKRDEDGNDLINVDVSWENGDLYTLQENLNTWLRATNVALKVVADYPKPGTTGLIIGQTNSCACDQPCGTNTDSV